VARGQSLRVSAVVGIAASRLYRELRSRTRASYQFEPERPPDHACGALKRYFLLPRHIDLLIFQIHDSCGVQEPSRPAGSS